MSGSEYYARYCAARSRDFCRESLDLVDAYRHASGVSWSVAGKKRREQIARIVLHEWEMLCPQLTALPASTAPGDFRQALTANVRRRIRQEVGFVWWLPIAYAVAEIIIRLFIQRWLSR
ncbi:MAG: hypothetical protein KGP14_06915 [Betaproteobacteria bacterium]|jgi:hypothetical protein|nr:hypothetical protein [Betaproteobacteria bacterium]